MKMAVRMLTRAMRYEVPDQDLRLDLSVLPARPKERLKIRNVARIRRTADMA
jgi:fatty-acid peroxygenase